VTTGGQNTALGYESLYGLATGSGNTALGSRSGKALTSGGYNTLQGDLSGTALTTGTGNVGVGANALLAATTGGSNVAVGRNALKDLTTASGNVAVGEGALSGNTDEKNTALGFEAGEGSTGSENVFIGYRSGQGVTGTNKKLYIGDSSGTLLYGDFLLDRVGIRTTSPTAAFQVGVSGDGTVAVANSWQNFSDMRLKKNFTRLDDGLEGILKLSGYRYDWREGEDRSRQMGVIAQEVQKVFPEVVKKGSDGILSVAYDKLVAPLIESVKSLHARLVGVDARVERLEAENADLKARLERLEKAMGSERAPTSVKKTK
jgi:hypothetical protein